MILLALAFFIYGIFSPSWAAKLWYNVRTFPQRITSWISSGSEFLDYDSYKSKISSIWDTIWDAIWDKINPENDDYEIWDSDFDDWFEVNIDFESDKKKNKEKQQDVEKTEYENDSKTSDKNTIKSFPKAVKFVELPELKQEAENDVSWLLSWYSKTDLLWVINKYIEKNLDDDTDILVTVEYEEDSGDPQRIIMQTQSRTWYTVSNSKHLMNEIFSWDDHWSDSKDVIIFPDDVEIIPSQKDVSEPTQKKTQTVKSTSTKLTQKEQKEAEEVFSILF